MLTTEGTDKTFIRGQQLLKHHSVPIHSQVNKVPKELPTPYSPPVTRSKTKSYLEAVTSTMPKSPKNSFPILHFAAMQNLGTTVRLL